MSEFYYARQDEDIAQQATSVVGSAEDAEYPATNLILEDPAYTAKLTTTSGSWVLAFASKVAPVAVSLSGQYLDAGLTVYLEGNDTDVWTSPSFQQAITIPAKRYDGPSFQRWTKHVLAVLDELDDAAGYLFWRLNVAGTNSQNVIVGRLALWSDLHEVDIFHTGGGIRHADELQSIKQKTQFQKLHVTPIAGPLRSATLPLIGTDLSAGSAPIQAAADFRRLQESSNDGEHPFLLWSTDPPFNGEPWLVYVEALDLVHEEGGYQVWTVTVREVSRGIPWP